MDEDQELHVPLHTKAQSDGLGCPRWQCRLAGQGRVKVWSDGSNLYACSCWGVAYAAIQLGKFDPLTGSELASARLGNEVISVHFPADPTILWAATEKKLFKLDREDLSIREKWDRGVPNSSSILHSTPSRLLLAQAERLAVFDLETAKVRKLQVGGQISLFEVGPDLLVYSAETGTLWNYQPQPNSKRLVAGTDECTGCSLDHGRRELWVHGTRPSWAKTHPHLLQKLGRLSLSGSAKLEEFQADIPVGSLTVAGDRLMVVEIKLEAHGEITWPQWYATNLHAIRLPDLEAEFNWKLPAGQEGVDYFPDLAAVVTTGQVGKDSILQFYPVPGLTASNGHGATFRVN